MGNRIRELRERFGLSQEALAKRAGTTNQQIGHLEMSRRGLTIEWMRRIADGLGNGVRASDLLPVEISDFRIPFCGEVQAGKWHSSEPRESYEEFCEFPLPASYRAKNPFALRVVGPSMNMVYPEGTILICCHLDDLREVPIAGKKYIMEDVDEAGGIETTVKEFSVDESGRPWAWPRSNHPDFQLPIALDVGRAGHQIRLRARVVFTIKAE